MTTVSRRWRHRAYTFFVLTAALAAVTGLSASPAAAGRTVSASELVSCNRVASEGSEVFGSLADLVPAAAARGLDGGGEPALNELHTDLPAGAKGKAGGSFKVTVPVYVHVVHDGAIGKVTLDQINAQITVMNLEFGGFEGGAKTGFSFELRSVDYTDNASWFYANPGGAEHEMKKTLHQGGANALNYYSTTAGDYLGWAYLPNVVDNQLWIDGIVIDWESMPGTSTTYAGRYDLGKTATHEAGHWLDLEHVFYRGCSNYGDFVGDTPPQKIATRGCPEGQDSCKEPGLDSIHNYMDYSYDSCYNQFTKGQAQRMRDAWLFYRAG
jgi:hypothetical protein